MNKLSWILGALLALAACNKPSEDDCRKAVERIRELTGTNKIEQTDDIEVAVRSCRGNATKESVQCAIEAGSLEKLAACGILKKEDLEALTGSGDSSGSGSGSATGSSK